MKAYITAVMKDAKINRSELARRAKVDRSTISRAASGAKSIDFHRLLKISKTMNSPIPAGLQAAYEALSEIGDGEHRDKTDRRTDEILKAMQEYLDRDPEATRRAAAAILGARRK